MFAFIILAISGEIYKRYGLNFSLSFFLVSLSTHWNVDFSRNLYWLEYTWFIPLLLGLCLINYNKKKVFIYKFDDEKNLEFYLNRDTKNFDENFDISNSYILTKRSYKDELEKNFKLVESNKEYFLYENK